MRELSNDQRKALIDSSQVFEAWQDALRRLASHRYGMTWKQAGGHEYLFRLNGSTGYGKSLGVRSPATEQIYNEFQRARTEAREREGSLHERLDTFAKVNKVFRVGRMPELVGKILRKLDQLELLGKDVLILGTHCLFAYEAAAGVQIDPELTASGDVDLMVDTRKVLSLAVTPKFQHVDGLLGMLRSIDRSFRPVRPGSFRAVNGSEFMVDLLAPASTFKTRQSLKMGEDDLTGIELEGLQWLVNAPRFEAIAVDQSGWPVRMVVPDPRAFATHKRWVAAQDDRSRLKSPRDLAQAAVVMQITKDYFPHLSLRDEALMMFPAEVRERSAMMEDSASPAGAPGDRAWALAVTEATQQHPQDARQRNRLRNQVAEAMGMSRDEIERRVLEAGEAERGVDKGSRRER